MELSTTNDSVLNDSAHLNLLDDSGMDLHLPTGSAATGHSASSASSTHAASIDPTVALLTQSQDAISGAISTPINSSLLLSSSMVQLSPAASAVSPFNESSSLELLQDLKSSIKTSNDIANASLMILGNVYKNGTIDQQLQAVARARETMALHDSMQSRILKYIMQPGKPCSSNSASNHAASILPSFVIPPCPTSHTLTITRKEDCPIETPVKEIYDNAIEKARSSLDDPLQLRIQPIGHAKASNSYSVTYEEHDMLMSAYNCLTNFSVGDADFLSLFHVDMASKSQYAVRSGRVNPSDVSSFYDLESKTVNLPVAKATIARNSGYFSSRDDIEAVDIYTCKSDDRFIVIRLAVSAFSYYAFLRHPIENTKLELGSELYRFYENIITPQCIKCHRFCHFDYECSSPYICPNCGDLHSASNCKPPPGKTTVTIKCHRCEENNNALSAQGASSHSGTVEILHNSPWFHRRTDHTANFHACEASKVDREFHRIDLKRRAAQFYREQTQLLSQKS